MQARRAFFPSSVLQIRATTRACIFIFSPTRMRCRKFEVGEKQNTKHSSPVVMNDCLTIVVAACVPTHVIIIDAINILLQRVFGDVS